MKRTVYILLTGIFLGATFLGGAEAAVETISAQRSSNPVYVDGRRVVLEAYNIGGNNYVKLRDVGKAVGFNVTWDGSAVQINSTEPYEDETDAMAQSGRIVTVPQSDKNFVLQVGDRVRCDDGTLYEITDMSRYDTNVFAEGPLPPLPTPTCDWGPVSGHRAPKGRGQAV